MSTTAAPVTLVNPRFRDFDVQGILNSAAYLEIVGEVRLEQMAEHYRLPMADYVKNGQTWIVASYTIQFKRPIKYPARFRVETRVTEINGPHARVTFRFLAESAEIEHASGELTYSLFDMNTKKTIPIPKEHTDIYLGNSTT